MTLRLGGDGAITGCTSLENPDLTVSGLTISGSFDAEKVLVASGTAAAPSYTFSGDTDNGLYYAGTNSIGLATAGANAILIDSSSNVGIGTTSPQAVLHTSKTHGSATVGTGLLLADTTSGGSAGTGVAIAARVVSNTVDTGKIEFTYNGGSDYPIIFKNWNGSTATERCRIDGSGRLLVGTSTTRTFAAFGGSTKISLEGVGYQNASQSLTNNQAAADGGYLIFAKSRGTSVGSVTSVNNDDLLGAIWFQGTDGTALALGATISAVVDGTPGTSDMPTRLVFGTRESGGTGATERMRLDSSGNLMLGTTTPGAGGGDELTLATSGQTGITIRSGTTSKGAIYFADGTSGSSRYEGYFEYDHNGDYLRIGTSDGERLRILSTGGLTFNGDTATANALNDYEEGYFSPTVLSGSNPSSTLTVYRSRYIKVGKKCTIWVEILFVGGDGGNFRLTNLPFNLDSTGQGSGQAGAGISSVGSVLFNNLNITGVSCLTTYLWASTIYFYYTPATDGASWTEITGNQVGGNTGGGNLIFSATYNTY